MNTITTNPGVQRFETGGPDGLITVEAGSPLTTDDPQVISACREHGAHAVTNTDGPATPAAPKALVGHGKGEL
jgi:hypothetical protein